jgi:acetate kinase
MQSLHIVVSVAEDILNRKSGWKALCGTTDFGEIVQKAELEKAREDVVEQNPYRLAFELFVDRVLDFVGSYHLKLGANVDALVFAGGIGERSVELRNTIGGKIGCLGYNEIDHQKNEGAGKREDVVCSIAVDDETKGRGKGRILVVKTDEQVCYQCYLDVNLLQTFAYPA